MDRNYYYRILGVRPDATPAQIKAAYDARVARLSSSDYADEPEYARRKKHQATEAYKVLLGVSPASTKEKREERFEKRKDRIERSEGFEVSLPKISIGKKSAQGVSNKKKSSAVGTAMTVIIVIIGLISVFGDLVSDVHYSEYGEEEYVYLEQSMQNAQTMCAEFDYYEMLDTSTRATNQANIDWDDGVGEYGSEPLNPLTIDAIYWLGINDPEYFYTEVTGIDEYYFDYDDYDCAVTLIDWISAPPFEVVAGCTDLYTGEPILSMTDYMEYLEEYTYEYS